MSSALSDYPLEFEDVPFIKPLKRVGKDSKMSNKSTETEAPAKVYNKTRGEHVKDMIIVALVVAIVAFGLGVKFQSDRNAEVQNAVKAATTQQVTAEVKK